MAYRLRPSRLLAEVATLIVCKPPRTVHGPAFGRRRIVRQLLRENELPVHVGCNQALRPLLSQGVRHSSTPIAALGDPAVVPESLHQRDPGAGDPSDVPASL